MRYSLPSSPHPPPTPLHVSLALKPEPSDSLHVQQLTKLQPHLQCLMIQVQMNLQDPDSLSCSPIWVGKRQSWGQARQRETQEGRRPGQRALLGSVGVCRAGSSFDPLLIPAEPVSYLLRGVSDLGRVFDGGERTEERLDKQEGGIRIDRIWKDPNGGSRDCGAREGLADPAGSRGHTVGCDETPERRLRKVHAVAVDKVKLE